MRSFVKHLLTVLCFVAVLFNNRVFAQDEYLIITPTMFINSLQPFINFKSSQKLSVFVATLDQIDSQYSGRDIQEKIRNCIKDRYSNNNTKWVLLVGKADSNDSPDTSHIVNPTVLDKPWEMPVRYVYCPFPEFRTIYVPTDLYYSALEGDWDMDADNNFGELPSDCSMRIDEAGLLPNVAIGRIPCTTVNELNTYIKKIMTIDYSTYTLSNMKTLQIYCKIDSSMTDLNVPGKILANVNQYTPATNTNINYELNNGTYPLFFFTGHGNRKAIGIDEGYWTGTSLLTGGSKFFAYIAGCETGLTDLNNDTTDISLTQQLLFAPYSGALGCVSCWRLSTAVGQVDLWKEFVHSFFDGPCTIPGKAFVNAQRSFLFTFLYWINSWYPYYRYTLLTYEFYGDPQFQIGNFPPNGPAIISIPRTMSGTT